MEDVTKSAGGYHADIGALALDHHVCRHGGTVQHKINISRRHSGDLAYFHHALNDADGLAAGLASAHGKLDSMIRVWSLGVGIGYGRYPFAPGVWEGGHTVVTLDEKERYCGCGGRGHMEGIMGHRAMRLRFLDMEPEEVFEAAKQGDARCLEFKRLWHKALAADARRMATSSNDRWVYSTPE